MDPILTKMEMSLMGSGWNDSDINKLNSHNHIILCGDGAGGRVTKGRNKGKGRWG
jgi:hypothetical protein